MAPPPFRSPFPRLSLSTADGADFRWLAQGLVADAVDEYEHFLWRQHATVEPCQWSLLREQNDVRVYQPKNKNKNKKTTMHELLLVGTVHGELDDALYGAMAITTDALRLHAAYTNDRVTNGAVLATLTQPSRNKPFRALTLKWIVRGGGHTLRALGQKKTDMVVLDATGTTTLSNGESVGFQLIHSVDLCELTPSIPSYARASVSQCTLWRQTSDDRVHMYAKAFSGERRTTTATTTILSDALLAMARSPHCAHMKKLAWLLRCKGARTGDVRRTSTTTAGGDRSCEVCSSQLLSLSASSRARRSKSPCVVCYRLVCASCRVKRALCTITMDRKENKTLTGQTVAFCAPCLAIAMRAAAADVAGEEAARESGDQGEDASVVVVVGRGREDEYESDECNVFNSSDDGERAEAFREQEDEDDCVDRFRGVSFRKSKPSSSIGGTLEDDEMADWSPAARHRAGTELQALYILGDA